MKKIALLIALAAAGSAQAATMSDSFTNAETTTEISQSGVLVYFDNLGGTLTLDSVQLILSGSMTTTISLTNNAAQAQTARGNGFVDLDFSSTPGSILSVLPGFANPAVSLTASTGNQTLNPGQTASFGPLTDSDSWNSGVLSSAGVLAAFTGTGNFTIGCTSLSGLAVIGGGGNVAASQTTTAGCGAQEIYNYHDTPTTVPEPATLGLLGLGLLGLGYARRRKAA
jgi:hypothetical protein